LIFLILFFSGLFSFFSVPRRLSWRVRIVSPFGGPPTHFILASPITFTPPRTHPKFGVLLDSGLCVLVLSLGISFRLFESCSFPRNKGDPFVDLHFLSLAALTVTYCGLLSPSVLSQVRPFSLCVCTCFFPLPPDTACDVHGCFSFEVCVIFSLFHTRRRLPPPPVLFVFRNSQLPL